MAPIIRPLAPDLSWEAQVLQIPFYRLRGEFEKLESAGRYLLWCERGMISRLHAAHLRDAGFSNVAVLDTK